MADDDPCQPTSCAMTIQRFLFILLLCFSTVSNHCSVAAAQLPPAITPWPKPTNISWPSPAATFLHNTFQIALSPPNTTNIPTNPYLVAAVARYDRLVRRQRHQPISLPPANLTSTNLSAPLFSLTVTVRDHTVPLQHGVDESYTLSIPPGASAQLLAGTPWGAMRGLETFSQLVWSPNRKRNYQVAVPVGLEIADRPLFPHRGVMLDTARNFYPVRDLLRTISAMAANKLNVFHWHVTDSQSFPIVLLSEPALAANGSYGPDMQYSPEDVSKIVRFAMEHGVRVIPEIDVPGHSGSWAGAYPSIVTCAGQFWMPPGADWGDRLAAEPGTGQLNPLNPLTHQVLRNVITDMASLFPDAFYHSGADEIAPACWKSDPTIRSYLDSGEGTLDQLLTSFVNSTQHTVTSLGRTAVYWEDVFLGPDVKVQNPTSVIPAEMTILQTWNNGPNNTKLLTAAGYRVIVSSSDFYYLDCGHGDFVGNDSRYDRQDGDLPGQPFNYAGGSGGSWCGPFKTWQRVYDYDITYGLSEAEAKLVLGGEVALWSEQLDAAVLDGRLWPRAAAAAEALWSGNRDETGRKRYAEATDRLNEWRWKMVVRGVQAEPIQPQWCVTRPGMCNLVQ